MEAHQSLKSRLSGQIATLETESTASQQRHESFAVEVKKFLQHLMEGVSGLTTWRESTTGRVEGLTEKLDEWVGVVESNQVIHTSPFPPLSLPPPRLSLSLSPTLYNISSHSELNQGDPPCLSNQYIYPSPSPSPHPIPFHRGDTRRSG